ncbi:Uncharacterised protein [Mycobacteroides abscessus]|nr:Uncharacterised protein [Mycobacteroides abscessus]
MRDDSRLNCWNTIPMRERTSRTRRSGRPVMTCPSTTTSPLVTVSSALTSRTSVDFPAPE